MPTLLNRKTEAELLQELDALKRENELLRIRNEELSGSLSSLSCPVPVMRSVSDNIRDSLMVLGEDGRILYVGGGSQGTAEADTVAGRNIRDMFSEDDARLQAFEAARTGGGCLIIEQRGGIISEWRSAPFLLDGKRLVAIVLLDITNRLSLRQGFLHTQRLLEQRVASRNTALQEQMHERMRAEEALRREREFFQLILDTDSSYISVYAADGSPRLVNKAFAGLFGFSEECLPTEIFSDASPARLFGCERAAHVCASGCSEQFECELEDEMGTFRWYDAVIKPLPTPSGEVLALSIATDVTERKVGQLILEQAHSELEERVKERTAALAELNERLVHEAMERLEAQRRTEESEACFKSLFFTNQAIKMLVERETLAILDANAAALQFYGYTREEMLRLSLPDITTTDRTLIEKRHSIIHEDGSAHFESVHKRKDGSVVDVEVYSGAVEGDLSRTTFSIVHDISERKRAERQVIEQRNHLTALMNALADCAMLLDTEGRIITLNTAAAKVLDATEEELVGANLFGRVAPKDETTLRRIIEMVMESGIPRREEYCSDDAVWDVTCYPVLDIKGAVGGIALYGKDVSARKKAEERVRWLSARVLSAQEDERKRIGRELHDSMAQTLSGIKFMMEADLAEKERAALPHDTHVARKVVSLLQGAIIELRRIIMDLRPTVLDDLGLHSALRWLQDEFSTMHGHIGIRLLTDMHEELLDERQKSVLFRIAQEALANAVRHSGADAVSFTLLQEGRYCCLTIADNGVGFDPQELSGSGIGLDSMRERLELVDGQLHILSEKGIGTQVRALVPLATSETSTTTSAGS